MGPSLQAASGEILAADRAADAKPGFKTDYLHGVLLEKATQHRSGLGDCNRRQEQLWFLWLGQTVWEPN